MDNKFSLQSCLDDLQYYVGNPEHSPFQELFNRSYNLTDLKDQDAAKEFSASIPTIERWRQGENSPHSSVQQSVYLWLCKKLLIKLGNCMAEEQ